MRHLRAWPSWAISITLALGFLFNTSILPMASAASPLAQTAPTLGIAASFAVLAGSTATNTGSSTVSGNLGTSPGAAVTGFPPGTVTNGTIHRANATAGQAETDLTTAYNMLAGQSCPGGNNLTGMNLGGRTLTSGVYCYSGPAQLTGAVTLDAQGNSSSVFIVQIGSTLTTASGSSVLLVNGALPCNVYWQVGSSATLGTSTSLVGSILALTSITLNTGADISPGRALARNGAVTMDTNTVSSTACAAAPGPTSTPTAGSGPGATATSIAGSTATAIAGTTSTTIPGTPGTPGTPSTPGTPGTPGTALPGATPGGNGNDNNENKNSNANNNQNNNSNANANANNNANANANDNQDSGATQPAPSEQPAPTGQAVPMAIVGRSATTPVPVVTPAPIVVATTAATLVRRAQATATVPATMTVTTATATREVSVPTRLPNTGGNSVPSAGIALMGLGLIALGSSVLTWRRRRTQR